MAVLHVELGQAAEGIYLYCANTLDQRQLVLVVPARRAMLESYYRDIASGEPLADAEKVRQRRSHLESILNVA